MTPGVHSLAESLVVIQHQNGGPSNAREGRANCGHKSRLWFRSQSCFDKKSRPSWS